MSVGAQIRYNKRRKIGYGSALLPRNLQDAGPP